MVGPVVNGSASTYVPTPLTGWVNVSGGPTTVGVHFAASGGLFAIDLVESGLPNGTSWSASLGSTSVTSTTHTIQFGEPNGTYVLAVGTVGNYTANYTSPVVVAGASVRATINFTTPIYPIRVSETGLPSGAEWTVSATNTATLVITSAGSTGASAILWLVRGGYTVSVTGPAGFQAALSQITLSVDGAAPPTLAATFAATVFTHTTAATLPAITLAALVVIGLVAIVEPGGGIRSWSSGGGARTPNAGSVSSSARPLGTRVPLPSEGRPREGPRPLRPVAPTDADLRGDRPTPRTR